MHPRRHFANDDSLISVKDEDGPLKYVARHGGGPIIICAWHSLQAGGGACRAGARAARAGARAWHMHILQASAGNGRPGRGEEGVWHKGTHEAGLLRPVGTAMRISACPLLLLHLAGRPCSGPDCVIMKLIL